MSLSVRAIRYGTVINMYIVIDYTHTYRLHSTSTSTTTVQPLDGSWFNLTFLFLSAEV